MEPPLRRALEELGRQWRYQRQLSRHIGPLNALRARALGLIERRPGRRATFTLHPRGLHHPVALRVASTDPETFFQVLVEEQYAPLLAGAPRVIVDAGANAGYTSAYFLSRLPEARVLAIAPFPDSAALCRRNLAPYGARARVLEAALWSSPGRLVLEGHGGHEWGVQVRPARPGEAGDVEAVGVADLGLARIDLLKIDIEGAERVLFAEGAERWLDRVGTIAVELHGPDCEAALRAAMAGHEADWSTAGELTILRNIRRRAGG